MKIFYRPKFKRQYKKLPENLKLLVKEKGEIFRKDPFDPRLKTHKLHGHFEGLLAFRIDYQHRIIFEFVENDHVLFHSVGNHDIYC